MELRVTGTQEQIICCWNCIYFCELVCIHPDEEIQDGYYEGAEDTPYAEECFGYKKL